MMDFNTMEVFFSLTHTLSCCDGCVMLCKQAPLVLPTMSTSSGHEGEKEEEREAIFFSRHHAEVADITWLIIPSVKT